MRGIGAAVTGGVPPGFAPEGMLAIQRLAGNRAARALLQGGSVPVQRRLPGLSSVKRAVGLGKKESAATKASRIGFRAQSAEVVTVAELQQQVDTLESATRKLIQGHKPGDKAGHRAAEQVNKAAKHIRSCLPDPKSKASKLLGPTTPDQARRLRWVIDETQLIVDEGSVAFERGQAERIYLEAGRFEGHAGTFTKLTKGSRGIFDAEVARPAQTPELTEYLRQRGFSTYEEAYDDALAKSKKDPSRKAEEELRGALQGGSPTPGAVAMFDYMDRSRSRTAAAEMGLSPAELAAIQTFTAQDYKYINPATVGGDQAWLKSTVPSLVDKPEKTDEEWEALQEQLASKGQTLKQAEQERRGELKPYQEEGSLHTGMALKGLTRLKPWKGTAYRGEGLDRKRFEGMFLKDGDGFRPKDPTTSIKSLMSISKSLRKAEGFSVHGAKPYQLIWEYEVKNGRDIERLSVARQEQEVAILPGAEFAISAIEVLQVGDPSKFTQWRLKITASQVK